MHPNTKKFERGVYTFGNTPRYADAAYGTTAQAIRDALEAVHELLMFQTGSAEIGRPMLAPPGRAADREAGGMVFAGGPMRLPTAFRNCTNFLATRGKSSTWTLEGCPTRPFSRASSCSAQECSRASAKRSKPR